MWLFRQTRGRPRRIFTSSRSSPASGRRPVTALSYTISSSSVTLKIPLVPLLSSRPNRVGAQPSRISAAPRTASSRWSQGTQYSMTTRCCGLIMSSDKYRLSSPCVPPRDGWWRMRNCDHAVGPNRRLVSSVESGTAGAASRPRLHRQGPGSQTRPVGDRVIPWEYSRLGACRRSTGR